MNTPLYAPNTGLQVEASINPATIQGVGGVTWSRLMLQATLHINEESNGHWRDKVQSTAFGMLTGELVIGSEVIGNIKPVSINRRRPGRLGYSTDEHTQIEIELDARRIEWIEQMRSGKNLEAKLRINLQVHVFGVIDNPTAIPFGLIEVASIFGEIPFACSESHWREKVLPGLGYGKVIALEIASVSLEACKALNHAFIALGKAQKHFSLGLYDDVVGSCRVALDQFFEQVEKENQPGKFIPKLKKSWENSLGESTYQWLNSVLGTIKTTANKPHHSPNNHFDRLEAQMLLMITTTLIAYAARQMEAEGNSGDVSIDSGK